jgi:hypothetical protein
LVYLQPKMRLRTKVGCLVSWAGANLVLHVSGKKEKELKKQQTAAQPKKNGKQRDHMHLFIDLLWLGLGKKCCVPAVALTLGEFCQRCVIRFFINPALYNQSRMTLELTPPGSLDNTLTGHPVPGFPAPSSPPVAHFSAADFFRDCPWLNVPSERNIDIKVEPLYPRLGLLGGAPEAGGKVSKLAALAAARKKKEGEKAAPSPDAPSTPQPEQSEASSPEPQSTPLPLRERLAASKSSKPSETNGGLRRLGKPGPSAQLPAQKQPLPEATKTPELSTPDQANRMQDELKDEPEPQQAAPDMRASPSMFASAIVGDAAGPTMGQPSHLQSNSVDLLRIYGQDHAEPFDFAGPSPDDMVLNAQSTAKGLAIRRKV